VPGVEPELHDRLAVRELCRRVYRDPVRLADCLLPDALLQLGHEERLARSPVTEQAERQRRFEVTRRKEHRHRLDLVLDAQ
jgi:hypothetical protein